MEFGSAGGQLVKVDTQTKLKREQVLYYFPYRFLHLFWEVNRDCQVICSFLCQENKVLNTSLLYIQV